MKKRSNASRRRVASGVACLLIATMLSVAPAVLPAAPFTVHADAAGCLDDNGHEVTCPISLTPNPLPVGKTIGEQELASAFGDPAGTTSVQPYEWTRGTTPGRCLPRDASCNLTTKLRAGSIIPPADDPAAWPPGAQLAGPTVGDVAVTSGDLNGDGRDESITAGRCPTASGVPSAEICLSVYNPATNGYPTTGAAKWFHTGEFVDTAGVGTIRLAAGALLRRTARISHVSFAVNDGLDPSTQDPIQPGGIIATFSTPPDEPHGFVPGQPVRFDDDPDLAAALCPALTEGSVLCGADLSADWLPVLTVPTPTTFTVRIGSAFNEPAQGGAGGDAEPGPVVPGDWPVLPQLGTLVGTGIDEQGPVPFGATQFDVTENGEPAPSGQFDIVLGSEQLTVASRTQVGNSSVFTYTLKPGTSVTAPLGHDAGQPVLQACSTCEIDSTGISPGVTMAWDGPGHAATIAAFAVRIGRPHPVRLIDDAPVGRLVSNVESATVDGQNPKFVQGRDALDLAVADFDGDGQSEAAVAWSGGIYPIGLGEPVKVGMVRFFGVSEGKQLVPLSDGAPWDAVNGAAPYSVSVASGFFAPAQGNTIGDDLAIGWGGRGHQFEVFDVTRGFQIRNVGLDDSGKDKVLKSGGKPAQWTPGTTYQKGDIVQDPLGFWQAQSAGTAACTQDVGNASQFYFPNPESGTKSPLNGLATDPGWDRPANDKLSLSQPPAVTALAGPLRGLLDPSPMSVTTAIIPGFTPPGGQPLAAGSTVRVVHGQFVSPALADQTISGTSLRMLMQAVGGANPANDKHFPELQVRLVSHDGSTVRTVLYSSFTTAPDLASAYVTGGTWKDSQQNTLNGGTTRRFPPTGAVFDPLQVPAFHVQPGDRLVVEFGTRIVSTAQNNDSEFLWAGSPYGQDLPADETQLGGAYSPFIQFSKAIKLDNCADHFGDTGTIVWTKVDVPRTVATWSPASSDGALNEAGASSVRVAAGDFDMNGIDEVVVGQTMPIPALGPPAPLPRQLFNNVQVYTEGQVDCAAPASPAEAAACPFPDANPIRVVLAQAATRTLGGAPFDDAAAAGIPQLSIRVGRVGSSTTGDLTFPNDVNPDVVVAWTCAVVGTTCGGTTQRIGNVGPASGRGVAVEAFDVCAVGTDQDGDQVDDVCPTPPGGARFPWALIAPRATFTFARSLPASGPAREWSTTAFALPDFDRDAKTLGTPLEYLETGHVQPLLIVRSPPVHFDVFDSTTDGAPGTQPDGRIDPTEVWDVNNCFTDYLATGEDYTCHTSSSYGSSTSVTSTLHGEVTNANTTAGSGTVGLGFGAGTSECQRSGGDVHVADLSSGEEGLGAFCVEGSAFLKLSGSESQVASQSKDVGRSFTYTSTVETRAGTDAVYAAVQQSEVLEYPIYAGAGFGFGSGVPIEYVTTKTPLRTRFQWSSSEDYNLPLTGQGHVGQNILSYARTEDQLKGQIPKKTILSATPMDNSTWVKVQLKDYPNLKCVQDFSSQDSGDITPISIRGTDAWGKVTDGNNVSRTQYPCAVGDVPVEIQDTHSALDRTYIVTQFLDNTTLRLDPTVAVPEGAPPATTGSMLVSPGIFPIDEWTVRRFHHLEAELDTNVESGFESSYGWSFGAGLEAGVNLDAAFNAGIFGGFGTGAFSLDFNFSTEYTHNELQTLAIGTSQETKFAVEVTGNIKPNIAYTIKPFLMQSPTGAMVLDWTTSANSIDTFWNRFYAARGPNPAFSLPDLLTPYKAPAPNSKPDATVPNLLRSSDFGGWNCDRKVDAQTHLVSFTNCVPRPAADPAVPLLLVATVHNYSLRTYDRSTPLKVRFYVGDPARGGYQIIDTSDPNGPLADPAGVDVPSVRSNACVNRFCLPAQGESTIRVPWNWTASYPGLTGHGTPADPLPIYAVIDPTNKVTPEVHDFTVPVEVHDCTDTYPTIDNEYNSLCPTGDNEAWFTQGFDGPTAAPADVSVHANDVTLNPDGSVQVAVHAPAGTGRVQVRLYSCSTGGSACVPQTVGSLLGSRTVLGFGAGGTASVRFARPGTGPQTLWVQVVPIDQFEVPGGGPFDAAGTLANNQVSTVLTIP